MRLGILIYSLSGGGAERVVSYLLSYCIKRNFKVFLICMNTSTKYEIPEDFEVHYIEKSSADESGFLKAGKIPILAYKYSRLVKRLKITHSLSFLTRPSLINIIAGKLTKYKFHIIVNERAFPSLQYGYKDFQSFFNKKMIKLLYKKSDLVISNSYGNAKDLIENFEVPSYKMKVINNPIDLHKIELIEPAAYFFNSKAFNVITVGRLDKGKNHALLINAIAKLENPLVNLYILGVGDLQKELELLATNLNINKQIIFLGFNSNPYQYLKSADLFIFGSNHEGFPNVLLEAMSCGLPILTTNCNSGPNEIMELKEVKNDIMLTDYGILVPIKNVELMAKAINYFINNKDFLASCRINSQKRIQEFNIDKILAKYISNIV